MDVRNMQDVHNSSADSVTKDMITQATFGQSSLVRKNMHSWATKIDTSINKKISLTNLLLQ